MPKMRKAPASTLWPFGRYQASGELSAVADNASRAFLESRRFAACSKFQKVFGAVGVCIGLYDV